MTAHDPGSSCWRRHARVAALTLAWCLMAGAWTSARPGVASLPSVSSQPQGAAGPSIARASSQSSVLDGVYTSRQASSGDRTFQQACAACHDTREFSGARFRLRWSGLNIGEMFDIVATLMPEDNPGSLSPEQYVDVLAYILSLNEYPVGDEPLPADVAALRTVQIEDPAAR